MTEPTDNLLAQARAFADGWDMGDEGSHSSWQDAWHQSETCKIAKAKDSILRGLEETGRGEFAEPPGLDWDAVNTTTYPGVPTHGEPTTISSSNPSPSWSDRVLELEERMTSIEAAMQALRLAEPCK